MTTTELQSFVDDIKKTEFNCQYNGISNKCKIVKIELETGMAYVEFTNEITVVKTNTIDLPFSNYENEYTFVDEHVKTKFGWIRII